MAIAYIALGSNLGDRRGFLNNALRRLRAEPGLRLLKCSGYYDTDPVGGPAGQANYLNAVAKVEAARSPHLLLQLLLAIEKANGRTRSDKDGPRTLDLDLLMVDDRVLETDEIRLPHPRLHERAFVLVPLAEIAGPVIHPVLKQSIQSLLTKQRIDGIRPAEEEVALQVPIFAGQRALVTGSTSGIGLAIAEALEARGATVIRHGSRTADLRDEKAIDDFIVSTWPPGLDILVCNAGADILTGPMAKAGFDRKLEALLDVDVKATMRLARGFGERMKHRGRGAILTMGWDQAGLGMEGDSGQLFGAAKGAVMAFTRSLAKTLAPEVRVNGLAPGWIRTAWGETAGPEWQERVRRETPLGIWGLPEDVAEAAVWLASPAAQFITGQIMNVNGGAV